MKWKILAGAACWALFALSRPCSFSPYTGWLLSLGVLFWCAGHFHAGFLRGLRESRFGLSLLVSTGAWAMFLLSTAAVFAGERLPAELREPRFLSLAAMVTLVNLGLWLEARFQKKSPWALLRLESRIPKTARVLREGSELLLPLAEVRAGERLAIRPGEPVPLDGEILEGETLVEETLHTGIEDPVEKGPGSRLYAGSVNKGGRIILFASCVAQDSRLRGLFDAVRKSWARRRSLPRAVDPLARGFFAAVAAAAALAAAVGAAHGPRPRVLYAAAAFLSVLSSACPWAVGLASPLALFFGRLRAARHGITLRDPRLLENFQRPDVVLFDKTGILSEGSPQLVEVLAFNGWNGRQVRSLLSAAEEHVRHPLLDALRRAGGACGEGVDRRSFEAFLSRGICAVIGERRVLAGSLAWLALHGIEPSPEEALHLKSRNDSLIALAVDGRLAGAALFSDPLRPKARAEVERLQAAGIESVLVSGDGNAAACHAAEQAGVSKVYAEAHEDEKAALVERLQEKGRRVAVLGEGLRDCLSMVRADLAFCAQGCAASVEAAADFTLARRDLDGFLEAVRLGLDVRRIIRLNFLWMFAVHALMVPLSVWALYRRIELGPAACAWTAVAASVAVLVNSLRLLAQPEERRGST